MQIVGRTNNGESIVYMNQQEVDMLGRLVQICGNIDSSHHFYSNIDPDYGPIEDYIDAVVKFVSIQYKVKELRRIADELAKFHKIDEALEESNAQHPKMGE